MDKLDVIIALSLAKETVALAVALELGDFSHCRPAAFLLNIRSKRMITIKTRLICNVSQQTCKFYSISVFRGKMSQRKPETTH